VQNIEPFFEAPLQEKTLPFFWNFLESEALTEMLD